eukprot:CAMPEP_0179278020 /NCGR_PEP_ID=MMETSP0797-20121207/35394_1 /TAXON_ID=47934 /ORGANISM="Dinophysis acuminata, Strain DAEP01" /LENGTH=52 /DNA_ID=CAMNT_0020986627 /DNA_START=81 /DNA_END=236 /DNA_ORIENTATION=+
MPMYSGIGHAIEGRFAHGIFNCCEVSNHSDGSSQPRLPVVMISVELLPLPLH